MCTTLAFEACIFRVVLPLGAKQVFAIALWAADRRLGTVGRSRFPPH